MISTDGGRFGFKTNFLNHVLISLIIFFYYVRITPWFGREAASEFVFNILRKVPCSHSCRS